MEKESNFSWSGKIGKHHEVCCNRLKHARYRGNIGLFRVKEWK